MTVSENIALRTLRRSLDFVLIGGFVVMAAATLGQVLFRYFLHIPAIWTEELARTIFVIITYFAMAVAVRDKDHIVIDFLLVKLPTRAQALILIAFNVAIVAFLGLVARGAVMMAQRMWTAELTMLEGVTQGHVYLAEFIAVIIMMLYAGLDIARQLPALRGRSRAKALASEAALEEAALDRDLR